MHCVKLVVADTSFTNVICTKFLKLPDVSEIPDLYLHTQWPFSKFLLVKRRFYTWFLCFKEAAHLCV